MTKGGVNKRTPQRLRGGKVNNKFNFESDHTSQSSLISEDTLSQKDVESVFEKVKAKCVYVGNIVDPVLKTFFKVTRSKGKKSIFDIFLFASGNLNTVLRTTKIHIISNMSKVDCEDSFIEKLHEWAFVIRSVLKDTLSVSLHALFIRYQYNGKDLPSSTKYPTAKFNIVYNRQYHQHKCFTEIEFHHVEVRFFRVFVFVVLWLIIELLFFRNHHMYLRLSMLYPRGSLISAI